MDTTHSNRERQRVGAGCPPVLATDTSRNDVDDPIVEWPPAPPTRDGHRSAPRARTGERQEATDREDPAGDETVARLAAGRAVRLLEASIEHLRTVLETSDDADRSARVERAIADVTDACESLHALAEPVDVPTNA